MTLRELAVSLGFEVDRSSLDGVERSINGVKDLAVKALGALGVGFSLSQMNALAEEFNGINDKIRDATEGLGEQKEIQDKIMKSANDTKMSYAYTADTVARLVRENRELFGSVDDAVAFHDAVTKTFKAAGKSNEEIAGLMEAINKSFAKGKVDTETINQLMEQAPEAVGYLNRQLGSTTDQLEQMVTDGKISLEDLRDAFVRNADDINAKFDGLDYSISDALLNIRNRWGYWLDDINAGTRLTGTLAKFMTRAFDVAMKGLDRVRDVAVKVTDRLGGMENVLKLLGISAGIAIAAFKGKQVLGFLKSAAGLLNVANLKLLAIVAVIAGLALIVDDFINFMQGNDSVMGDVLKKMGYDVDGVRDRIITAWNKVKGFLTQVWLAIQQAAGAVAGKLKEFWVENGEEIKAKLVSAFRALKTLLGQVFNSLYQLAVSIFGALKGFWDRWGSQVSAALSAIFSAFGGIISGFLSVVTGVINFLSGVFSGDWEKAWTGIRETFEGVWLAVQSFFTGIWEAIYAFFGDKIDACIKKVTDFVDKVKEKIEAVKDFFSGIVDGAGDFFGDVGDFFAGGASVTNSTVSNTTGTGNRTSNVNQDVKIENTFYGTDQQTMSAAATRAAEDTTAQLARGLAYGT